ncbi:hypothetical protein, partial [Arcobacter sp. CECT 8985]|uniref:hypothetical protein n=1 Tax=Arcobacter sp. CECT 8985 TaxID=1935424 RepID=UPI00102566F9
DIFYNFRNELLNFEKNRLKNMKKEYFDKNAKTFFIRLNTDDNASYKRIYYQSKYYMIISNFEESKRMNNIEGVILDIKRQNGKDYVYIETSVSKEFLIGNLIILSIIILNLLIFCFNFIIYLFAKKKKRII